MADRGQCRVDEPIGMSEETEEFRTASSTASRARRLPEALRREIGKVIVGHEEIVEGVLTALIAGGHVLLEGVPGLGKTLLVKTLSDALHLKFQRIQFTPDLMPADVIGTNVVLDNPEGGGRRFEFQAGPVFANLLLTDEINRATPKTQSALLEAMQEKCVTVAGKTNVLPRPFFVLATQNPLEMEGTYPLPEAQLDRFFFKLMVEFPDADELEMILDRTTEGHDPRAKPVLDGERILEMSRLARQIPIADELRRYGIDVVLATHPEKEQATELTPAVRPLRFVSPRRGCRRWMILAAKIRALLDHRYHVSRDDIKAVAKPALRHRLILNFEGQAEGIQLPTTSSTTPSNRSARPPPSDPWASQSRARRAMHEPEETLACPPKDDGPRARASRRPCSTREFPQEARIPLARLAPGLPRADPRPAGGRCSLAAASSSPTIALYAPRRRLPLPRLERLRLARRACS